MDNREPIWSFGESQLLYDPTDSLDTVWSFGESVIFDEYVAAGGSTANIMLLMDHFDGGTYGQAD